MKRALALLVLCAGCTTANGDLVLREGYASPDDPCQKLGYFFSNDAEDASPDMVACPPGQRPDNTQSRIFVVGPEAGRDVYYVTRK